MGFVTSNEYDKPERVLRVINPRGFATSNSYDQSGNLVAVTNAIGKVERYLYDEAGNLQERLDANGQTTWYYYDALNRLTNRQSAFENVVFSYDPNGNLTNLVDALGVTRQTFDPMNRLVTTVDPFGQTVSNRYDQSGRRVQLVYPDGKTEQFGYDRADRLTNALAPAFGLTETRYAFDPLDKVGIGVRTYVHEDVDCTYVLPDPWLLGSDPLALSNRYWLAGAAYHLTHRCHDRSFLFRFVRNRDALLSRFDGITWPQFQSHYRQFVEDALTSAESMRRAWRWTEAIAVGSSAFVSRVEADLVLSGRRARLDLDEADDGAWILREESPVYGIRAGIGAENRAIGEASIQGSDPS